MTIWKIQSTQGMVIGTCPQDVANAVTHLLSIGCSAVRILREDVSQEMFDSLSEVAGVTNPSS